MTRSILPGTGCCVLCALFLAALAGCGSNSAAFPRQTTAPDASAPPDANGGGGGNTADGLGSAGGMGGTGGMAGTGGTGGTVGPLPEAGALPRCSDLPKPPAIASCVQPVGGWTDGSSYYDAHSAKLSGTITAVLKGPVTGGCLPSSSDATSAIVGLLVHADSDAGAEDWDVEYEVASNSVTWTVGEHIDVAYSKSALGWSPTVSALTLNFGQAVDVYIGAGGTASDLSDVPLTFRQGSAICQQNDTCGAWSGYDLEVKDVGGWTRVPYGATSSIGGYVIIHGGMSEQLSGTTTCEDWYVSSVQVAVLRNAN